MATVRVAFTNQEHTVAAADVLHDQYVLEVPDAHAWYKENDDRLDDL
jgi:hypothetical protein